MYCSAVSALHRLPGLDFSCFAALTDADVLKQESPSREQFHQRGLGSWQIKTKMVVNGGALVLLIPVIPERSFAL